MQLKDVDNQIHKCNLCSNMVGKLSDSKKVSIEIRNDIVILDKAQQIMVVEKVKLHGMM